MNSRAGITIVAMAFVAAAILPPSVGLAAKPSPPTVPAQPPPKAVDAIKVQLGERLYFDENLSEPAGQSCASCHHPDAGFADPDSSLPVSKGVVPGRFGNRNSPTAAYTAYSPGFHWDPDAHDGEGLYVGGQFWDGRADDVVEQAMGPFLNPVEMNNSDEAMVVEKVQRAKYAALFEQVYGPDAFQDTSTAYRNIADAIAWYEMGREVNRFTSKYDWYLAGKAKLTEQEAWGLELFNSEKATCWECHPSTPGPFAEKPLFTDFSYSNLGMPANPEVMDLLEDWDFVDLGLGAVLGDAGENGKFKTPTLRNIALTAPYGHNGYFKSLKDIVDFYNTRDVPGSGWPAPEVPQNVYELGDEGPLGDLDLTADEVDAIVAFLHTLTDGYRGR
jgi:cytochrome c peroxidase